VAVIKNLSEGVKVKVEIPDNIVEMAVEMKRLYDNEENAATAKPIVHVYDKKRICIPDDLDGFHDGILDDIDLRNLYVLEYQGEYDDFLSFEEMKEFADENKIPLERKEYSDIMNRYVIKKNYVVYNSQYITVYQASFFTMEAAKGWINANRHNLNNPFTYIHSTVYMSKGWQEMETIYDFMIEIANKNNMKE
jgi:hypothetical protein